MGLFGGVFKLWCATRIQADLCLTNVAYKLKPMDVAAARTEMRLLSILVAVCADVMGWIDAPVRFAQRVNHSTCAGVYKTVALAFSFPFFEIHNLLFEVTILIQKRQTRLLVRQGVSIAFAKGFLEFVEQGLTLSRFVRREQIRGYFCQPGQS